ncbi:MAG: glutathione S-transferase [Clostridia bacterium]|nr:glutathione S-transferase [Clostridia bacterium]
MSADLPILYSFRRCPYAIRARMAIAVSGQQVEHREVDLKHKPTELVQISPKATVPVLQLNNGKILEESLDIMHWALTINDPQNWLMTTNEQLTKELIENNDNEFKQYLDRYKYADRFPENPLAFHRDQASHFPARLNTILHNTTFLVSDQPSLVDVAIFPFIRQFAFVDKHWFDSMPWGKLHNWLDYFLNSQLFESVMKKHQSWKTHDDPILFP